MAWKLISECIAVTTLGIRNSVTNGECQRVFQNWRIECDWFILNLLLLVLINKINNNYKLIDIFINTIIYIKSICFNLPF